MRQWCVIAALVLSACSSSKSVASTAKRPVRPPDCNIAIITQCAVGAFEEIGICNASKLGGGIVTDNSDKALMLLKQCSCEAGGNAVLLINQDDTSVGWSQQWVRASGSVLWVSSSRVYED